MLFIKEKSIVKNPSYGFQVGDYVQLYSKQYLSNKVYYIAKIIEGTSNKKYILCKDGKLSQPLHEYDIVPLEIEMYFSPEKNGYKRIVGDDFASIETVDVKPNYPTLIGEFEEPVFGTASVGCTNYTIKFENKIYNDIVYMHQLQGVFRDLGLPSNFNF